MSGTARLCSPCRRAIKRARHETVSVAQPLPSRGAASIERRRARRAAASAANDAAQVIPPLLPARRSQFSIFFGVAAVVVCAVTYLAVQHLYAGGGVEHVALTSPLLPAVSAPVPQAAAVAVTPAASVTSPVADMPPPPRPRPAAKPAPSPVIAQLPETTSPLNAVPPPPVVEPAPPPAPAPRAAPPPDRSQLINAGFGQCPRDNVIATAVCEQGVRLKYCEGYWGLLAQCPAGRANDYGQ
jgi:hypothetical protein